MNVISDRSQPATIEEAYAELSVPAFAVWIRLQMATPKQLLGRAKIAKIIDYSSAQSDTILRELKYKGYIQMIANGQGKPSQLVIQRRTILSGPSSFVRLSNFTFPPPVELTYINEQGVRSLGNSKQSCNNNAGNPDLCFRRIGNQVKIIPKSKRMCVCLMVPPDLRNAKKLLCKPKTAATILNHSINPSKTHRKKPTRIKDQEKSHSLIGRETTHGITGLEVPQTRVKMTDFVVDDSSGTPDRNMRVQDGKTGAAILPKNNLSLSKIKKIRNKNKAERSERAKENAKKRKKPKVCGAQSRSKVNWDKLDQRGNPAISFSPSAKKRKKMIEILDQSDANPVKRSIVEKMASEWGRIYSRYRRMLQKQKGNVPTYLLPPQERKYAAKAAEWCIRKGVTPKQVLVYWHLNIGNFAEKKMDIPPLVFLSSPANIDTVACASLDGLEAEAKQSKDIGHGFSDKHELDHRLRPALEAAGHETILYSDRHLLTIQKTAQAIAKGARLFVGAGMKPLVDWASTHLYEGKRK